MNILQKSIIFTTLLGVLLSYTLVFRKKNGYIKHPLWLGMDVSLVKCIVILQLFAAIGFVMALLRWMIVPPSRGILAKFNGLFITLLLFSISANIWPWAVLYKHHFLVVSSLCLTAIASIILLAGSIEDSKTPMGGETSWLITLGLLFLSLVTVLVDGVLWNAMYITLWKNDSLPII